MNPTTGELVSTPVLYRGSARDQDTDFQTSIIGTIGPKTNTVEKLQELREAGMNIGMSHRQRSI